MKQPTPQEKNMYDAIKERLNSPAIGYENEMIAREIVAIIKQQILDSLPKETPPLQYCEEENDYVIKESFRREGYLKALLDITKLIKEL